MRSKLLVYIFFVLVSLQINAQEPTPELIAGWEYAGKIDNFHTVLEADEESFDFVNYFYGDNTGKQDNSEILQNAINQLPAGSIIYFPPGKYLFTNEILLTKSITLRGRSPNATQLIFDLNDQDKNLITVSGHSYEDYYSVVNSPMKGNNIIKLRENVDWGLNDYLEIEQKDSPSRINKPESWASWNIGHLVRINKREGYFLYLDRNFPIDYIQGYPIRVHKIDPVKNVTIERLTLERIDDGLGYNFHFNYASNCVVKCVKSKMATRAHLRLDRSRNCWIFGNLFEDAHFHCNGGAGYGVLCNTHSTENLIENNIFRRLRHSIVLKEGAYNNVFSLNYSTENIASPGNIGDPGGCGKISWELADVSLHGHYPYNNLFEQNFIQWIKIDNVWGKSGAGNTFLRNRVESEQGIQVEKGSDGQNFIGNMLTNGIQIDNSLNDIYRSGNLEKDSYDNLPYLDLTWSYYYQNKPEFVDLNSWPLVGPEYSLNNITIPARSRWEKRQSFDEYCCGNVPGLNSILHNLDNFLVYFENDTLFIEYIKNIDVNILIYDLNGKVYVQLKNHLTNSPIPILHDLNRGLYVLRIYNKDMDSTFKILNK